MSKPPTDDEEEIGTFEQVMLAIDETENDPSRHLSIQLDTSMQDAIRSARVSGQPATVTIKVKVRPGPESRVEFSATVDAKLPRPPVNAVTLFADDGGGLHKSNPKQEKLPFHLYPNTRKDDA